MFERYWDNKELQADAPYAELDVLVRKSGWWMIEQIVNFKSGTMKDEELQKLDRLDPEWVELFSIWLVTTGWISPKAFDAMIEPDSAEVPEFIN